jgi:ACS family glucarate transporter-like MFS transporter
MTQGVTTAPPAGATTVRHRVLAFTFGLAVITYLDRVCISAAAPYIMDDLHLTLVQMSVVFSAFTLAYSLFEIPSGWWGDRHGQRRVLTRIALWWSGFTALTGAARGYGSLLTIRFLFGAGEAGAFPNIARSISRWFPIAERGRANGVMFLGSRVGGMLSVPLTLLVIQRWGWRASFAAFGALGLVWAAGWYAWYRDRPEEHPQVNGREAAWIAAGCGDSPVEAGTPWRAVLTSRNLYTICAMYFAFGYGLYFYFTWLPTYLIRELKFSVLAGGLFASLPFIVAGVADIAGGWTTDRLAARRGLRAARCGLGSAAFATCAALLLASTMVPQAVTKAVLLALALGSADMALSACWAVCSDVGARHAGVVSGCMNTFGNLGGFVGPIVVGVALERWHSWAVPFYIAAGVYAGGAVAWLAIDPEHKIDGGGQTPPKVWR